MNIKQVDLVLVTGASGYVALHCVQQLLEAGFQVRGTVRSLKNQMKVKPLTSMKNADTHLELVEADLMNEEDWPKWVQKIFEKKKIFLRITPDSF